LMALASPVSSFLTPTARMSFTSKLNMAKEEEEGPVLNKYSR
jgi:hypothetical protein